MTRMSRATGSSNSLAPGMAVLAQEEGRNDTRYPGVAIYRFTVPEPPTRYVYPSSLVLVGAGRKQVSLGNKTLPYDAGHYLVVTSPMPIHSHRVFRASSARPRGCRGAFARLPGR